MSSIHDPFFDQILLNSNIKIEPEESDGSTTPALNETSTLLPSAPPWSIVQGAKKIKEESPKIGIQETNYLRDRANEIQRRLADNENKKLVVNMPKRYEVIVPESNVSPFILSAHNSTYSFQATSKNINNALNSNPYGKVPLEVQQNSRFIGANTQQLIQPNLSEKQQIQSLSVEKKKEMKDRETQTTKNTATINVVLTEHQLRNLSREEKDALLKLKNVSENRLRLL